MTYFKPGSHYLGGNFFYSDPTSYCAKFTEDNELDKIIADDDTVTPDGLRDSILTFLEVCAYKKIKGETNCNFMIHPNVKIDVHNKFVNRVQEFLNLLEVSFYKPLGILVHSFFNPPTLYYFLLRSHLVLPHTSFLRKDNLYQDYALE